MYPVLLPLLCSCGWDTGKELFAKTCLKSGKTITTVSGTGNSQAVTGDQRAGIKKLSQNPPVALNRATTTVIALRTVAERAGINPAPTFSRATFMTLP
jgi:hypothetical protein